MKKQITALSLTALLLLSLLFAACAAQSGDHTAATQSFGIKNTEGLALDNWSGESAPAAAPAEAPDPALTSHTTRSASPVYANENAKLIRQANLTLQTEDYPATVAALDALTAEFGGYFERVDAQDGGLYDANARRYAHYTIRVPAPKYDAFLARTGELGHVVSRSEQVEDVGAQYHDTELRLKTLVTKQDRLLALLDKADKMEDIISLENALSTVQYEIESYTTTLRRYDDLVGYATIYLNLNEVLRVENRPGEGAGLPARLGDAFTTGIADFGAGLGDLAVWLAYRTIGLALAAVAIVALVRALRRRTARRAAAKPAAPERSASKTPSDGE